MRDCFICSKKTETRKIFDNFSSNIVQCKKCGLIFEKKVRFDEFLLKDPYFSDEKEGHYNMVVCKLREELRRSVKTEMMRNIKKFVSNPGTKKILDIGCSTGDFLEMAFKDGFNAYGLDISGKACKIAQ